jgi:hypothetical protein
MATSERCAENDNLEETPCLLARQGNESAVLQASPSASPRKTDGQLRAALAAAQKELLEATVSLEAQKQTSNGLQALLIQPAAPDELGMIPGRRHAFVHWHVHAHVAPSVAVLQIRVEELLRAAAEVERLRHENAELQRKAGTVHASEQQRRELEAGM